MAKLSADDFQSQAATAEFLVRLQDSLCDITTKAAVNAEAAASRIGWLVWVMLAAAVAFSILAVALLFTGRDLTQVVTPAIGVLVTGTVSIALRATKSDEEKRAVELRTEAAKYCPTST